MSKYLYCLITACFLFVYPARAQDTAPLSVEQTMVASLSSYLRNVESLSARLEQLSNELKAKDRFLQEKISHIGDLPLVSSFHHYARKIAARTFLPDIFSPLLLFLLPMFAYLIFICVKRRRIAWFFSRESTARMLWFPASISGAQDALKSLHPTNLLRAGLAVAIGLGTANICISSSPPDSNVKNHLRTSPPTILKSHSGPGLSKTASTIPVAASRGQETERHAGKTKRYFELLEKQLSFFTRDRQYSILDTYYLQHNTYFHDCLTAAAFTHRHNFSGLAKKFTNACFAHAESIKQLDQLIPVAMKIYDQQVLLEKTESFLDAFFMRRKDNFDDCFAACFFAGTNALNARAEIFLARCFTIANHRDEASKIIPLGIKLFTAKAFLHKLEALALRIGLDAGWPIDMNQLGKLPLMKPAGHRGEISLGTLFAIYYTAIGAEIQATASLKSVLKTTQPSRRSTMRKDVNDLQWSVSLADKIKNKGLQETMRKSIRSRAESEINAVIAMSSQLRNRISSVNQAIALAKVKLFAVTLFKTAGFLFYLGTFFVALTGAWIACGAIGELKLLVFLQRFIEIIAYQCCIMVVFLPIGFFALLVAQATRMVFFHSKDFGAAMLTSRYKMLG